MFFCTKNYLVPGTHWKRIKEEVPMNDYPPVTLQPLYNTVHYNTVLDITQFKDGSQKCIDCIEK